LNRHRNVFPRASTQALSTGLFFAAVFLSSATLSGCKPGRKSGENASNVFSLPAGNYRFVRGTMKAGSDSLDVFAKGGTGKVLSVVTGPGGSFVITDKGKYDWSVGDLGAVGLDCTLKNTQDVWTFSVYSVEGGIGKLSGGENYKRGCSVEKEPDEGSPLRPQWRALTLTPKNGTEFELQQEATVDGKKHVLTEWFRKEP
jgi:hypothetical protein